MEFLSLFFSADEIDCAKNFGLGFGSEQMATTSSGHQFDTCMSDKLCRTIVTLFQYLELCYTSTQDSLM